MRMMIYATLSTKVVGNPINVGVGDFGMQMVLMAAAPPWKEILLFFLKIVPFL
jgi:hypothetical protein